MDLQKTYRGKPCRRCKNTLRWKSNYACVSCNAKHTKQSLKKYRLSPEQRARAAAYARWYRTTPKGKEVNRVNQANIHAKYSNVEGTHTTKQWMELLDRYNHRCLCCGRHETETQIQEDHVVPLIKGGSNWIDNIQPLCRDCNGAGGKWMKVIDFRQTPHALCGVV